MNYKGRFGKMNGVAANDSVNPMVFVMGFFFMLFSILGGSLFYVSLSQKAGAQNLAVQPLMGMVDVLIPLKDISAGDMLNPTFFEVESRPENLVSSKAVRNLAGITGKYAAKDIPGGKPLNSDFVMNRKPNLPISGMIPVGYRAVTIRVDVISSVEGWTRPGAVVDVHWIGPVAGDEIISGP
jgi:Flp pilus assembly protein CpaB